MADDTTPDDVIAQARAKLKERFGDVRTGGKGTARRKKRAVHKATTPDDKRLQNTLKRLGVSTVPGIEEVNLFKEDGKVIHFVNPKVQASIAANTYVVSGTATEKEAHELGHEVVDGYPFDDYLKMDIAGAASSGGDGAKGNFDDDEVPDLVENFEDYQNKVD